MRGMFTVGVIDTLMRHGVTFDGLIGVSAGAAFGCNYKSRQPERGLRYNKLLAKDWRMCSVRSWLTTGDLFGAEFAYHIVPRTIDPFDCAAFEANPMAFYVVCTDVDTGEAVYKRLDYADDEAFDWIRASASMPVCSRIVNLDGRRLLDGGISDSIPLEYFESIGYRRNVVVLTQPSGYHKELTRAFPVMRMWLRKHSRLVEALRRRHEVYNRQLEYVAAAEREDRAIVIRPPYALPIGHTCHDPAEMQRVYDIGVATAQTAIPAIEKL